MWFDVRCSAFAVPQGYVRKTRFRDTVMSGLLRISLAINAERRTSNAELGHLR